MKRWMGLSVLLATVAAGAQRTVASPEDGDWPAYGGDQGGQRYSWHTQIDTKSVGGLEMAWVFHTDSVHARPEVRDPRANFEATPVLWHRTLYFDTPFDEVFALDAVTGRLVWSFDPAVDRHKPAYIVSSRGVALWHAKAESREVCGAHRVFVATLDRRLMARDAATGKACEGFGVRGTVDLAAGMGLSTFQTGMYGFTSPPVVVGDAVIVGSSIGDNQAVDVAPGVVRAFDARTGRPLWSWDPLPWAGRNSPKTGSGNAWAPLAADVERDLVFVPTGSAAVDFYGGQRQGDDRDADSLVALRASTGKKVWAFQLVHHDLWDYDTPEQPLLFTFRGTIPAIAITGKTGMTFVLNRLTGEPLYPVTERPVAQTDLPGEKTWPTQPFSSLPTLTPLSFGPGDITVGTTEEKEFCRTQLGLLVNHGVFTPVGETSTLMYPGDLGGANWGSSAMDPATGVMYVHTDSLAFVLKQNTRFTAAMDSARRHAVAKLPESVAKHFEQSAQSKVQTPDGGEVTEQAGTPYKLYRLPLLTASGLPCAPAPFGALVAMDLNTAQKLWSVPVGTMIAGQQTGTLGMGGPMVTAGGVVFLGASSDAVLRAFDAKTGALLWQGKLPAPASATPMTYAIEGRQYVVAAAGGHGMLGEAQSDAVVAFALPARATEKKAAARRR